jgi:hypothetical protein
MVVRLSASCTGHTPLSRNIFIPVSGTQGVMFITIAIQMVLADVQMCLFMQQCELLWDPSCTDFMKSKFVVDDSVGRMMTNLQTICDFINSHLSNSLGTCTLSVVLICGCSSVVLICGCRWASTSYLMHNTCVNIF